MSLLAPKNSGHGNVNLSRIERIYKRKRSCTDLICCALFLVFIAGWSGVVAFAFRSGDPKRLIHPSDSAGRFCGVEKKGFYDLRAKPYLLYFDLTKCFSYSVFIAGCPTSQICVSTCPSEVHSYLRLQFKSGLEFEAEVQNSIICRATVDKNAIRDFATLKTLVDRDECASYTVPYVPVLGRCLPKAVFKAGQMLSEVDPRNLSLTSVSDAWSKSDANVPSDMHLSNASQLITKLISSKGVIEKIAADLSVSWWQIISFFAISAVVSFLWIVIMRVLGGMMIWATLFAVIAILSGGCVFSWMKYQRLYQLGVTSDYSFQPDIYLYFEMPTTWLVIAITLSVILVLVLTVFCCVCSRIKLAVALIEESSKMIGSMGCAIIFPVIPFLLKLASFSVCASVAIWLASSGKEICRRSMPIGGGEECNCSTSGISNKSDCQYSDLVHDDRIIYLQSYNLFAFFWFTCFASGLADIALAGAFASYYWAFNKSKDVPSLPIFRSFLRTIRYHLGTVAFGTLLLALTKFIRAILDLLHKRLSSMRNPVAECILRALKWIFWLFEKFLKFLTSSAFIMTAIHGTNFCTSSKNAFLLLTRNIIRYAVLDKVTDFLLFTAKATITLTIGAASFYWFSGQIVVGGLSFHFYYYFVPIIAVVIGTYSIASSCMNIYEVAVKTTFMCFLEDLESNDGTPERPYYMSKNLQQLMDLHNHFKA